MDNLFSEDSVFIQMIQRISDVIALNVIFLITCLPVFTIGTALTSLNYTALTAITYEDGYISKKYFKSFKQNFKQSTLSWLLMMLAGFVLTVDVVFWIKAWTEQRMSFSRIMIVVSIIMLFAYCMILVWLYPIMSKFNNTIKMHVWNALTLSVRHFPWTLLLILTYAGSIYLSYAYFYYLIFMVVAGFGLFAYLYAFMFRYIFKKYLPEDAFKVPGDTAEEEAEEAEENSTEETAEEI